jgi:hypothetical protein
MGGNLQNLCSFCGYSNHTFANCRKREREHGDSQQDNSNQRTNQNRVCNALFAVTPIMLLPFVENTLGWKKKSHLAILLLRDGHGLLLLLGIFS